MKTIKDFDYDLYKDGDRCFIRVKRTQEVCEVSDEVFKLLRNEHMQQYRNNKGIPVYELKDSKYHLVERKQALSLDNNDIESCWGQIDGMEDEALINVAMKEFYNTLTEKQKDVLKNCMLSEMSIREFSRRKGVHKSTVDEIVRTIRLKYKKYSE